MSETTDRYIKELTEDVASLTIKMSEVAQDRQYSPAYLVDLTVRSMTAKALTGILLRLDEHTTQQEAYWKRGTKKDQRGTYTEKRAYRREDE